MANPHEVDDLTQFEAKETAHRIPVGWSILFWGLIVWGIGYLWAYTPALGGWSQAQDADGGGGSAANLLATIAFTVIPTVAAIAIILVQRAKRKA